MSRFWALLLASSLVALAGAADIEPSETVPGYLAKYGIAVEEHWIPTDDGYILGAFRLARPGQPVILLQHGILASAWCWIDNDPAISPGIQLYEAGYDVWLTNSRGNTYSRNHTLMDPSSSRAFWNFSFADMGRHDVPANIKYILKVTGQAKLSYFGWSQGTSQMFVAMQEPGLKDYITQSVNLFVALSPVTFLSHQTSTLIGVISNLHLGADLEEAYPYDFMTLPQLDNIAQFFCNITLGALCKITVDVICGTSSLDTAEALTNLTAHFPAGTSVMAMNHYEQLIDAPHFQDYDYGEKGNLQTYGTAAPPQYNITEFAAVPTALFYGSHDDLADATDGVTFMGNLGDNSPVVYANEFEDFSHVTWYTGTADAFKLWYTEALTLLKKYAPSPTAAEVIV